jgi:threonine dehydrogenase-like Zn-dependent dehydrogenase
VIPERGEAGVAAVRELTGGRGVAHVVEAVGTGSFDPGPVFDLTLPLESVAEGYAVMSERRSITTMSS